MVEAKITIARILADRYEILVDFKFGGCNIDYQTAKFNSPPNFPAIQYVEKCIKLSLKREYMYLL